MDTYKSFIILIITCPRRITFGQCNLYTCSPFIMIPGSISSLLKTIYPCTLLNIKLNIKSASMHTHYKCEPGIGPHTSERLHTNKNGHIILLFLIPIVRLEFSIYMYNICIFPKNILHVYLKHIFQSPNNIGTHKKIHGSEVQLFLKSTNRYKG